MTPRTNRGAARKNDLSQADGEAMPRPLAQRLPPVVEGETIHREPGARRDRPFLTELRAACDVLVDAGLGRWMAARKGLFGLVGDGFGTEGGAR
jgi:hypothetical protein